VDIFATLAQGEAAGTRTAAVSIDRIQMYQGTCQEIHGNKSV